MVRPIPRKPGNLGYLGDLQKRGIHPYLQVAGESGRDFTGLHFQPRAKNNRKLLKAQSEIPYLNFVSDYNHMALGSCKAEEKAVGSTDTQGTKIDHQV